MANRIKGITVEIGGDTTGLDKALKSVNSSITKTQSALNDVNRLLKLDPSNTVLVAQKQELLAQAVSQTEEKLFAATGTEVDDYADVLGSRLTSAIKNGTANSDQLRTALEKIGKSATGGKADIRQLTDALDTVDDGQAIQNLIQQLNEAGDAAENTADDVGQIADNTKGAALMQAADQLSAVGDKIQEIGDKALDAYTDTENAVTKVNAYFGETGKAAEQSAAVIKNVYSSGVGESMDAVANAVLMVKKNLGDLSETDLTNLTQQALTLEELYGIDMNETLRGVSSKPI